MNFIQIMIIWFINGSYTSTPILSPFIISHFRYILRIKAMVNSYDWLVHSKDIDIREGLPPKAVTIGGLGFIHILYSHKNRHIFPISKGHIEV